MDDSLKEMITNGDDNVYSDKVNDMLMRMMMNMNFTPSHQDSPKHGMCAEGNWSDHPIGPLFRAVKNNEIFEVEELLQQEEGIFRDRVNEVDGDEVGVLHILALDRNVTEEDAVAMVQSLKDAGANLDLRAGRMMSSETPLHVAACYGNIAVIKALIDAGATADISDDNGRVPKSRAQKQCTDEENKQISIEILEHAMKEEYERSKGTYVYPPFRRAGELCKMGDEYLKDEEWDLAAKMYRQSIECNGKFRSLTNPTAYITHAKLATCKLNDAMERIVNGNSGYRACFKEAYEAALKCTELEPNYEDGWKALARGYIGFRELPRAKQAAATGYQHFPGSKLLHDIWTILHLEGVPDAVVDHDSQDYKDIYSRIYYERWIGPIQCPYCELKCMDDPRPSKCPFCGCPDKDLEDQFEENLNYFLLKETPYAYMCEEEEDDENEENDENDSESDDEGMPPLLGEKKESGFTFQAPTPNNGNGGAPSFSFGSPPTGSSSQPSTFVFGSPDHKQDSSKEDDDEEEDGDKNESKRDDEKPLYVD